MLLSIITVRDDQEINKHRIIIDNLNSASAIDFFEKNKIEFLTVSLKDILNFEPEVRIFEYENIINNSVLKTAKGKYVWIIPAFYRFHFNVESIKLLIQYLNSDVDSISISDVVNKDNNFLFLYAFETIIASESGENFRFILRKSDYINCFLNKQNFGSLICYLTTQNVIHRKIPSNGVLNCKIVEIKENFNRELKELFFLPSDSENLCHLYYLNVVIKNIHKMNILNDNMMKLQEGFVRHYLFSICSELKRFFLVFFENNLIKEDMALACSAIRQLIAMLNDLNIDDLDVCDNVRRFSEFLLLWMDLMCVEDISPNIFAVDRVKSPLDPVWYLGDGLKDMINESGKKTMETMHSDLVQSIEKLQRLSYMQILNVRNITFN
jgi:hypothetical protein